MQSLIRLRKALRNAIAPLPIKRDGLFDLDIDNSIWQDIRLNDDPPPDIPDWLGDDNVRKGI